MRYLLTAALVFNLGAAALAQDEEAAEGMKADETTAPAEASSSVSNERVWRVGPSLNFSVIPSTIGVDATYTKQFSGGFHVGTWNYKKDTAEAKLRGWDLVGRWHPWLGSFFVGLGYAAHSVDFEAEDDIDSGLGRKVTTKIEVGADTNFLMPHLGWMAVWDNGFTLGFEIGYKFHMNHKTDKTKVTFEGATAAEIAGVEADPDYKKARKNLDDVVNTFAETSLPYINLIKVGYLF